MFNPFKKTYTAEDKVRIDFLKNLRLFSKLSDDDLFIFLPYLYPRKYKKDEAVFFRKDPSQALYIIKEGEVSLSLERNGQLESLMLAKAPEAIGDNSLIENTSRIYNAIVASEEAELLVLPQGNIMEIFESKLHIKALILESLLSQYNEYTSNIFEAYKSSFGFFELRWAYEKAPQKPG